MPINTPIIVELLILINGPIFQTIAYIILLYLFNNYRDLVTLYHVGILLFNLLPIYPLDGGKLLNLLFNTFISYKKSLKIMIYISYIITIFIFIINNNIKINIIVMGLFLLYLIKNESNKIELKYNKFLLERYLNNYNFKNIKIINNINKMYRGKKHIIKCNGNYYLENELLEKKYKKL